MLQFFKQFDGVWVSCTSQLSYAYRSGSRHYALKIGDKCRSVMVEFTAFMEDGILALGKQDIPHPVWC